MDLVAKFCEKHQIPSDHGMDHLMRVRNAALQAVKDFELTLSQIRCIELACLLHDVDDRKFFNSKNYENAKKLLDQLDVDEEERELILKMISLVSASKNGNVLVEPSWLLIPRDADRLDALGLIGWERCIDYTIGAGKPMYCSETKLAVTNVELDQIIEGRYEQYLKTGKSASSLDHLYDKLLHLKAGSGSLFMIREFEKRCLETRQIAICLGKMLKCLNA